MAGPGALLLLGGVLGGVPGILGVPGGVPGTPESGEAPPELEEEVSIVRRSDPQAPHCFSRTLHDLSCVWDSPGPPDPRRFRLQFRLEQDPWQECPLTARPLTPGGGSRFLCSLPPAATVTFVPLELRVLPATPPKIAGTPPKIAGTPPGTTGATTGGVGTTGSPPLTPTTVPPPVFHRTLFIDQVVLPGPPQNVSVTAGGARGELCVRWAPPPAPYLHSSLVFELALSPPGGPPKTVGVPAGRREQGVGGLRGSTPYSVRARARPDGVSYGGFWSPWSPPATATTPPDLDAVTLGLSCLLVLLLLGLGALGLLGHRRTLRAKLWPPVPGPEREFEGLFSAYGGNFQLWLCQASGSPCAPPPPPPEDSEDAVEEVGGEGGGGGEGAPEAPPLFQTPLPQAQTPPHPPGGPSPSPSFEYTLFDPGSALLCPPPRDPSPTPKNPSPTPGDPAPCPSPYANLRPPPSSDPPPPQKAPNPSGGAGGSPRGWATPPITSSAPERVTSWR